MSVQITEKDYRILRNAYDLRQVIYRKRGIGKRLLRLYALGLIEPAWINAYRLTEAGKELVREYDQ